MKTRGAIHPRVAEYAEKEAGDLAGALGLPARGYTEEEAEARRAAYGANALEGRPEDTVAHRLRRAFVNPFSVVLFVLAGISFVTDVLLASNYSRDVTTAAIILSMLLVGGSVRFVQELRSKRVADRLTGLMATTVPAWRKGRWQELPSAELVVGDRVRLSAGDRVPADLRLTAAQELFVTQSVLTGKSAILEKTARPLPKSENRPLAQYHNIAFMGSAVVGGSGEGIVLAVGPDTVYGGFSAGGPDRKNGFDRGANSIAWVLIRFMAVLVPVVFIACGLTKGDWLSAFLFALSVAVGLTPEMLPFLPMMSLQLIFLNLIYDLSCTAIPWDNVDEEFLKAPPPVGRLFGGQLHDLAGTHQLHLRFPDLYFHVLRILPPVCLGRRALQRPGEPLQRGPAGPDPDGLYRPVPGGLVCGVHVEPDPGHPHDPHPQDPLYPEPGLGAPDPADLHRYRGADGHSLHPAGGPSGLCRPAGELLCLSDPLHPALYGPGHQPEKSL